MNLMNMEREHLVKMMPTAVNGGKSPLKVLIIARTEAACVELQAAFAPMPGISVEALPTLGKLPATLLQGNSQPSILLIDIDSDSSEDLDFIRELRGVAGIERVSVIALTDRATDLAPLRAIRAGADDVLLKPVNLEEAREVFSRAIERPRPGREVSATLGKIIVFMHLSGGAGATTLAVNSGSALARAARNHEACLLDLDIQFGNAANLLDLPAASPIQEFIDDPSRLDAEMLESMMLRHATGLHVLSAPRALLPFSVYGAAAIRTMLELARRRYEFVVADCPVALAPWTDAVLESAFVIYLVTPLSVPAAHRLNKFLELLRQEGMSRLPLKIVANRYQSGHRRANDITVAQFEKATGAHVDFLMPNDYSLISMSHGQGKPAVRLKPNSPFTASLKQMLAADLGKELFAPSRRGFFSFRRS